MKRLLRLAAGSATLMIATCGCTSGPLSVRNVTSRTDHWFHWDTHVPYRVKQDLYVVPPAEGHGDGVFYKALPQVVPPDSIEGEEQARSRRMLSAGTTFRVKTILEHSRIFSSEHEYRAVVLDGPMKGRAVEVGQLFGPHDPDDGPTTEGPLPKYVEPVDKETNRPSNAKASGPAA